MEIKEYKAPRAKVIEVKVQGVLCSSLDPVESDRQYWEKGDDI